MAEDSSMPERMRWARLRFSIVGPLLSSPPEAGELAAAIAALAGRPWRHPTNGEVMRVSGKSIERWYYIARGSDDVIAALAHKVPKHAGTHPSITSKVADQIRTLRSDHPRWTYQLIHDNLVALGRVDSELLPLPGYATVCRFMKDHGLGKQPKPKPHEKEEGFVARERRSFESAHVHGLWHCDFHAGKRKVITVSGEWMEAVLFAVLDDRARLCCHAQWYLGPENTESFVHGVMQALQKRGLCRSLMSDNGAAMTSAEAEQGLARLAILHPTTLPHTPQQNGKQEVFWAQVEGRLMAMLEGEKNLTLELLNRATQAWVEQEYNHRVHSETQQTPTERWLAGPSVARPCPSSDELRRAFRMEVTRQQRMTDGTISVEGIRFEVPSAYRTLLRPTVRVARWDLSTIELVDPQRGTHLATLYPLDKTRNAERARRAVDVGAKHASTKAAEPVGIAPLLRQLMAEYAATGLPPAYVPRDITARPDEQETQDE